MGSSAAFHRAQTSFTEKGRKGGQATPTFALRIPPGYPLDSHAILGALRATLPSTSSLNGVYRESFSKPIRERGVVGGNRKGTRNNDHGRAAAGSHVADRRTIGRSEALDSFH